MGRARDGTSAFAHIIPSPEPQPHRLSRPHAPMRIPLLGPWHGRLAAHTDYSGDADAAPYHYVQHPFLFVHRLVCLNNCLNNLVTPFQFFRNEHLSGKQIALIDYSRLRRRNIDNNVPDSLTNSRAKRSVWTVANSDL